VSDLTFPFAPAEPYAWPGGYVIGYLMDDGEYLCSNCMNDDSNPIHAGGESDGWRFEGIQVIEEGFETCAHCNASLFDEEV